MRLFIFLIFLFPFTSAAQQFFQLKGEVLNPTEDKVILTLYRNWVEEPEDYSLFLDAENRFSFQVDLDQIAYLDINYGLNGVLFQIIEPEDDIHLKFDTNQFYGSFNPTGKGSEKWTYYLKQRKTFETDRDIDREVYAALKEEEFIYFAKVDELEKEQISLLEGYKSEFSEKFFRLRRADILGRMNQYKLDYLMSNDKWLDLFERFDIKSIDSKLQDKSFEYGFFIESLLSAYRQSMNTTQVESNFDDYSFIKYCFDKDWITKPVTERILAGKINGFLDLDGFTNENQSIVIDFSEFSNNEAYSSYLLSKLAILKGRELGQPAPDFVLTDVGNKSISLKDLKGSNVLMVFWASWCEPCIKDLEYLPIINSYFKNKKVKLDVLNIAVDTAEDFASMVSKCKTAGRCIRMEPNSDFLDRYSVSSIPAYLLLDDAGNWLEDKLTEPALDEGRGLIKQLENILGE